MPVCLLTCLAYLRQVAKHSDIQAKKTGVVLGGDYVSLYQRQRHTYLHREDDGTPLIYQMKGAGFDEAEAPPATDQIDMLWQVNLNSMAWSGSILAEEDGDGKRLKYSVKDAVSQTFLTQNSKGEIGFAKNDTDEGESLHDPPVLPPRTRSPAGCLSFVR